MNEPLVSIVIPTKNSAEFLDECLTSVHKQVYKNIEIIIVDGQSKDGTIELAQKHECNIYQFNPNVRKGTFDAPHRRNYGAKKAKGEFVYYVDVDMELTPNVVLDAVCLCDSGYQAVIIPEDSFGIGIWAQAKNLERRCYYGDDSIEAPRFLRKSIWMELGGLDESLGGGGDDWDLHQKLRDKKYTVGRTKSLVMHNEGNLKLKKLVKKRFMYGLDSAKYIKKRPNEGFKSYFPIRKAYIINWKLFLSRPIDTTAFIVMRIVEYLAGFSGISCAFYRHWVRK
ncbi:glycosyltransferase family 2 protein [Methanococcoides sp. AM1]|uniref:glycosyltransferase family 2 protein n=1 Tax=Methanococcoides sp. AM1 TaxID=1201011 RepID=UPI00108452C4|nr:glycosyltransferase family A protein [Methanococcoides sp. AM1]